MSWVEEDLGKAWVLMKLLPLHFHLSELYLRHIVIKYSYSTALSMWTMVLSQVTVIVTSQTQKC